MCFVVQLQLEWGVKADPLPFQGAHAGLIMSYFCFYIYKAIRKVLFFPSIRERSYKGLIFGCYEISI